MNEFEVIEKYFIKELGGYGVSLGIGDDCALLQPPVAKSLATSMDTLVGGIHFPKNADPELIAERCVRVNISDLAAMGAEPLWYSLGLTIPSVDHHWLDGFSRGLFQAANLYNCMLIGGDTTRGPLNITLQVFGSVPLESALTRGGAKVGDLVYVTGHVGDGAAAVAVIKQELQVGKAAFNYFMSRYYRPVPRIQEGQLLRGLATSAIDVSDGLMADLGHICKASGVGAVIDLERVPVSEALKKLAKPEQVVEWALTGGDDYQLCFTLPADRQDQMARFIENEKIAATQIGEIIKGSDVTCLNRGKVIKISKTGYQHF